MRQLGLDPGSILGWAVIDYAPNGLVDLVSSGTLDARGKHGLSVVRRDLEAIIQAGEPAGITTEELLETKGKHPTDCPRLAYHVEGVVRELLEESAIKTTHLPASTVKRLLGCRDKAEVREFVKAVLGDDLKGKPDHETDAIGIAIAGMMRAGKILPRLRWAVKLSTKQARIFDGRRVSKPTRSDDGPLTREEIIRGLESGAVRLARGGR